MAGILSFAIADLAERFKGQLLLELPDELPSKFLGDIIDAANVQVSASPLFGWLLVDRRIELESFTPCCGFRELAQLREDQRLVVCFASDNRGMSTYTTVFAPLFGPEFPSLPDSETITGGVASLEDLASAVAERIGEAIESEHLDDELIEATNSILGLLAQSYRKEGNTRSSWVSRWWLHVASWADEVVHIVKDSRGTGTDVDLLRMLFGAAGLPSPDSGASYKRAMRREYAATIHDRWASLGSIRDELGRLVRRPDSSDGAQRLEGIDWETELVGSLDGGDSLIGAVALAGASTNGLRRSVGWASISETAFLAKRVTGADVTILRRGRALPEPWPGAQVLRVAPEEVESDRPVEIQLRDITIVIPLLDSSAPLPTTPDVRQLKDNLSVNVTPGEVSSFELKGARTSEDGLEVDAVLGVRIPSWTPKPIRISVSIRGDLAEYLGDQVSTKVFLLGPVAVLALYRRSGLKGKDATTRAAQIQPDNSEYEQEDILLDQGGLYASAVAFGVDSSDYAEGLCMEPVRKDSKFEALDDTPWLHRAEPHPLENEDAIECKHGTLFSFQLKTPGERPLSPLVAACIGTRPSVDSRSDVAGKCFGHLEQLVLKALKSIETSDSSHTLGHILLTTCETRHDVDLAADGYYKSRAFSSGQSQRYPPSPSSSLRSLPEYAALVKAYRKLGLCNWIEQAERQENSHGLSISRVSLRDIDREKIEELLKCYTDLISAADLLQSSGDGFWARFPMSVVAYPESLAQSNCDAVFLSPAHPIRLAWLWQLEKSFAVVREETGEPPAYSRLSEGWTFPWTSGIRARFGSEPMPLISVPCDSGPDYVFVGWSSLVRTSTAEALELRAPSHVNGFRFPAGASSGLTESAVEGALRAFVRVFPQVRTLVVELPAYEQVQRSVGVDTALGDAFRRLTSGEDGQSRLPGGMRVRDSLLRLGPVPARDEFVHRDQLKSGRRKIEWERCEANVNGTREDYRIHIRLVETQISQMSAANVGVRRGAFPRIPLRRFPRRARHDQGIVIDPSFDASSLNSPLAVAVAACESVVEKRPFALFVMPGASFSDLSTADWTVTGDAGLDPSVLQKFAVDNSSRHMLWEWRPAIATGDESQLEQRPFVTISRVPEAFSASLREKVSLLLPESELPLLSTKVDGVVSMLAQRGIGLNSLLAMGHHHATGALGFFFALQLLTHWASSRESGEVRLIVPVDAVDPFLRAIANPTKKPVDTSKLADLLVLSCLEIDGKTVVRLVPVEIKHYGLVRDEEADDFPTADEVRIEKHVKQLTDYIRLLGSIQALREQASEIHGSLIDTAIASLVDAAIMLDSELQGGDDPRVLRDLSCGSVELQICPGVLLWFQKGGAGQGGSGASWSVAEESAASHAKVFVDPVACWREIWLGEPGDARATIADCLSWTVVNRAHVPSGDEVGEPNQPNEASKVSRLGGKKSTDVIPGHPSDSAQVTGAETHGIVPQEAVGVVPSTEAVSNGATRDIEDLQHVVPNDRSSPSRVAPDNARKSQPSTQHRGLPKEELERRYRLILKTFQEFRVPVHAPDGGSERYIEGPASIAFGVRPGFGVPVGRIESQVANLKLRLQLDDKAKIDFKVHRGLVLLDVPKADDERYFVDAKEMWSRWSRPDSGFSTPIGEDRYGAVVALDWADSNSPHLLLAGQTGSGKSVALMAILAGATNYYSPDELRLILVDPKRVELTTFEGSPHLLDKRMLSQAPEAAAALERAVAEMEARYLAFAKAGRGITNLDVYNSRVAEAEKKPRWLIVLDEYADLTHDPTAKSIIEASLTRLAQKARAAGIHVLVSTQKPIVEVISTIVRGNLPAQLALRVRSATESLVILDESGAEKLTGKGDALLKIGGNVVRLQCASFKPE